MLVQPTTAHRAPAHTRTTQPLYSPVAHIKHYYLAFERFLTLSFAERLMGCLGVIQAHQKMAFERF